jgi:WD40 repeat protein
MEAAIIKPAERLGVQFEPGLISRIIQDIGMQPGTLPLLQYVLYELFENRTGEVLTLVQYDSEGGVHGALARRAETLFAALEPDAQAAAERLFLRLVVVGEGADDTRRRLAQAETMQLGTDRQAMQTVIDAFGRHRLLTFDRDSVTRAPTVEIAHEALIKQWGRLRGWVDQNRTLLRQRQQLAAAAAEWVANGRDSSFLARGGRLSSFEALPNTENVLLMPSEVEYLDASLRLRRFEAGRTRRTVISLAGIATIALIAAVFAVLQRNDASRERDRADLTARVSRADQLAIQATSNRSDLDLALLLNIESLNSAETYEARRGLLESLQYSPRLARYLHGTQAGIRSVAVSEDGARAAASSANGDILVWSLEAPDDLPIRLAGHQGAVNSVDFSPDGRTLASGGADATVRLWDIETQTQLGEPLVGHEDPVWDVTFSPDGSLVVSASEDSTLRMWEIASRSAPHGALRGHTDPVYAVAFSPDGQTFASGAEDGTVRVWDTRTGNWLSNPLIGHDNWVLALDYSPDGSTIASSDANGIILFWSVDENFSLVGEPIRATPGSYVWDLDYSPDGAQLATASADDTVRLWSLDDRASNARAAPLIGHTNDVWGVEYLPNGNLISGGRDGRVLEWVTGATPVLGDVVVGEFPFTGVAISQQGAIATGTLDDRSGAILSYWALMDTAVSRVVRSAANQTTALAFIGDTDTLLATDSARRLLRWGIQGGEPQPIAELDFTLYTLAISPDGRYAAVAGDRSRVVVYDLLTDNLITVELMVTGNAVYALAFTPSGDTLAAGDNRGQVTRWRTSDWTPIGEPVLLAPVGISALAYSDDEMLLAIGTRDLLAATVQVLDAQNLRPVTSLLGGHENWVIDLDFLDNTTLASASHDATVRLWTIPSGESLVLRGHAAEVTGIAQRAADTLISVGDDRRLLVWDLTLEGWVRRACAISNRNLSGDEWQRYMGDEAYRETCPTG